MIPKGAAADGLAGDFCICFCSTGDAGRRPDCSGFGASGTVSGFAPFLSDRRRPCAYHLRQRGRRAARRRQSVLCHAGGAAAGDGFLPGDLQADVIEKDQCRRRHRHRFLPGNRGGHHSFQSVRWFQCGFVQLSFREYSDREPHRTGSFHDRLCGGGGGGVLLL